QYWGAWLRDTPVGVARRTLAGHERSHTASVEMRVAPRRRRRGIGTAVLRAATADLPELGRTSVYSWVRGKADGLLFAQAHGLEATYTSLMQQLRLDSDNRRRWEADVPQGYHVERWIGAVPDQLIAGFTVAKNAIHDIAFGSDTYRIPSWTPQRIRAAEADYR